MKISFFKAAALIALIFGFVSVNTALAKGEHETKFTGVIERLPNTTDFIGDWRVDGRIVHVTSGTAIEQEDGQVSVGAKVKVEGRTRADGSVDAMEIEVKTGSGSGDDNAAAMTAASHGLRAQSKHCRIRPDSSATGEWADARSTFLHRRALRPMTDRSQSAALSR